FRGERPGRAARDHRGRLARPGARRRSGERVRSGRGRGCARRLRRLRIARAPPSGCRRLGGRRARPSLSGAGPCVPHPAPGYSRSPYKLAKARRRLMADYIRFRLTAAKVGVSMALLALIAGVAEKARPGPSHVNATRASSSNLFLKLGGLSQALKIDFLKVEKKIVKLDQLAIKIENKFLK